MLFLVTEPKVLEQLRGHLVWASEERIEIDHRRSDELPAG
jgi:hypothetical protein